VHSYSY